MSITGNFVGSYSQMGKTFILVDEDGNEMTGVVVDQETVFTAGDNDVREGMVYASDSGVSTGTKDIPPYYANYGAKFVLANKEATIYIPKHDYNNLLITISTYNTSIEQSVELVYVSIENGMYTVSNKEKVSDISIDTATQYIKLGVTVSEKSVLRYSIIMEEI